MHELKHLFTTESTCGNPSVRDVVKHYLTEEKNYGILVELRTSIRPQQNTTWCRAYKLPNVTYKSLQNKIDSNTALDSSVRRQIDNVRSRANKTKIKGISNDTPEKPLTVAEIIENCIINLAEKVAEEAKKTAAHATIYERTIKLVNIEARPGLKNQKYAQIILPPGELESLYLSMPANKIRYGTRTTIMLERDSDYWLWGYTKEGERCSRIVPADDVAAIVNEA